MRVTSPLSVSTTLFDKEYFGTVGGVECLLGKLRESEEQHYRKGPLSNAATENFVVSSAKEFLTEGNKLKQNPAVFFWFVKSWLVHIRRGKTTISNPRYLDFMATNLLTESLVPMPYLVYPVNLKEPYHQDFMAIYTAQSLSDEEQGEVTYKQVQPGAYVSTILGIMQTKDFELPEDTYLGKAPPCPSGSLRRTTVYTVIVEGPSYTTWTTKSLQTLAAKLAETEFVLDSGEKVDSDLDDILETYEYLLVSYRIYILDNKTPANLRTIRNPSITNLRITRDELPWPNAMCRKQTRPVSKL
ncbi:hypothetical protein CSKR_107963, partial [Clonorchis sinensis]